MASLTRVTLPKHIVPRFPERCVICGRSQPDSTTSLMSSDDDREVTTECIRVPAPACGTCASNVRRKGKVTLISLIAFFALAFPLIALERTELLLYIIMTAFAALMTSILWHALKPDACKSKICGDVIEYRFTDKTFAAEFRACNRDLTTAQKFDQRELNRNASVIPVCLLAGAVIAAFVPSVPTKLITIAVLLIAWIFTAGWKAKPR